MNEIDGQTLLLVEDNEDDVFIFKRAYRQAQVGHPLQVVNDGEEAYDYLTGGGGFADRAKHPLPFLVLLDLKLPFKSGLEVLEAIRATPELERLCVVVLTSSAEERDIARARELGAQAYLVKPPTAAILQEILSAVRARLAGQPGLPRVAGDFFAESTG